MLDNIARDHTRSGLYILKESVVRTDHARLYDAFRFDILVTHQRSRMLHVCPQFTYIYPYVLGLFYVRGLLP